MNWIFQPPTRRLQPSLNYVPRGETVTAAYLHKALAKIYSGYWALKTKLSVQNLLFARPSPKAASTFNNWLWKKASRCSPSSIIRHISHQQPFISSWKWNQIWQAACWPRAPLRRACRGSPHHRYRRACCRSPGVDGVLQKYTRIADDQAKNYLNQVSL